MKRLIALPFLIALAACSMPSTVVRTPDTRPALVIDGAPKGSVLFVDGLRAGDAEAYDGQPTVLSVEPGTHLVSVKDVKGETILEQTVYVESEIKTLRVR